MKEIEKHRPAFDAVYNPVLEAAGSCRKAGKAILSAVSEHRTKLLNRDGVKLQKHAIEIPASIDVQIAESIRKLFTDGVIATKSVQQVTRFLGIDIAFVFARQGNFEKGLEGVRNAGHPELADFLSETRTRWSETFIKLRGDLEHNGWTLPHVQYNVSASGGIQLIEPVVDGVPVSTYSQRLFNRVLSFVENLTIYGFQSVFRGIRSLVEIPREQRNPDMPERFRLLANASQQPEWTIMYSDDDFP